MWFELVCTFYVNLPIYDYSHKAQKLEQNEHKKYWTQAAFVITMPLLKHDLYELYSWNLM